MYLTKEEERTYDGEHGWANQICMRILVRLGELFNATGLIPIGGPHCSLNEIRQIVRLMDGKKG